MGSAVSSLSDEKYVSFTTFRKNGERKSLPVWIVDMGDGTLAFTTGSGSWKVKRLNNDPRIELQPCDQRGRVREGSTVTTGTATATTDSATFQSVRAKVDAKYKWMAKLIQFGGQVAAKIGKPGQVSDCAVIITLDS